MNPDEHQFGKINSDLIQRNRSADTRQNPLALIAQAVADLHHKRNLQLAALGINGVIAGMVGRQAKPVRVEMGAHKSILFDRVFQVAQALHPPGGVNPGQPGKAVRVALTDVRHPGVRNLE